MFGRNERAILIPSNKILYVYLHGFRHELSFTLTVYEFMHA